MSEHEGKNNHQDFYKPQCYNELPQASKNLATFHLQFAIDACLHYPAFGLHSDIQPDCHHCGRLSWNTLGLSNSNSVVLLEGDKTLKARTGFSTVLERKLALCFWLFLFV